MELDAYRTTLPGQMVEQLREKFGRMSLEGMGQVRGFEPPGGFLSQTT